MFGLTLQIALITKDDRNQDTKHSFITHRPRYCNDLLQPNSKNTLKKN